MTMTKQLPLKFIYLKNFRPVFLKCNYDTKWVATLKPTHKLLKSDHEIVRAEFKAELKKLTSVAQMLKNIDQDLGLMSFSKLENEFRTFNFFNISEPSHTACHEP